MDCGHAPLLLASFLAAAIAEFAFACLGFGPAILYEISWQLCALLGMAGGGLEQAVANIIITETPCGIVQMIALRRHFNLKLSLLFNVPIALTVPLATLALEHFGTSSTLKRLLGVFFLVIAAIQLVSRRRKRPEGQDFSGRPSLDAEPRSWSTASAIVLASTVSGLFRGLFGVAGPPVMVLVMCYPIARNVWRCTAVTTRLTVSLIQGITLAMGNGFSLHCWPMYLSLMLGGLLGLGLGNLAAPHVDAAQFQNWLMLFLTSGAMLMLVVGYKTLSTIASVLIAITVVAAAVSGVVQARRRPGGAAGAAGLRELAPVSVPLRRTLSNSAAARSALLEGRGQASAPAPLPSPEGGAAAAAPGGGAAAPGERRAGA